MPREDTQFKPGESGNPTGRPSFREAILKVGAEFDGDMTQTERSVRAQFKKAIEEGDTTAIKFLATHLEGSKVDQTSNGETITPIQIYIPDNGRD